MTMNDQPKARPLWQIARDIQADGWINSPTSSGFHARPYFQAMSLLNNITDSYGCDSAESIVLYFLSNAGTWRGKTARRVKAELKAMLPK